MRRRRFEIAFPTRDNELKPISSEIIKSNMREIGKECGGYSYHYRKGYWRCEDQNKEYFSNRDIFIIGDVENTQNKKSWFRRKKDDWRRDFRQKEIYVVTYLVDLL